MTKRVIIDYLYSNDEQQHGGLEMTQQKGNAEAPAAYIRDPKSRTDQVKEDGIMKELYQREEQTRESWERKWGFMKNPKKLWMDEAWRRGLPPHLFAGKSARNVPASPTWAEKKSENIRLSESRKISETSSGMIGWRSSILENDYNRIVGPLYQSWRLSMNPPLSEDEPDPSKQRFIFLG